MSEAAGRIVGLYDDHAEGWIADRGRTLGGPGKTVDEVAALERFVGALPAGAAVLDVGCGSGWPWGAALLERGFAVTGIDASPSLIAHAAETLPAGEWGIADMRTLDLGRTFDGLLIWYSLFHLTPTDQRTALERILAHAAPRCGLMMTAGDRDGVSIGEWRGEPLYHASLGRSVYDHALEQAGFSLDPDTGPHLRIARRG